MRRIQRNRLSRPWKKVLGITICVAVAFSLGCQSMMHAKAKKELAARTKFKCGENMPPRIPPQ